VLIQNVTLNNLQMLFNRFAPLGHIRGRYAIIIVSDQWLPHALPELMLAYVDHLCLGVFSACSFNTSSVVYAFIRVN
jgi:hypothetical protein